MKTFLRTHFYLAAVFTSALLLCFVASDRAWAKEAKAADNASSGKTTETGVAELVRRLHTSVDEKERISLAQQLAKSGPRDVPALTKALTKRTRSSTDEQRRAVLALIEAEVPDETGRFSVPERQTKKKAADADVFDWFAKLAKLREQPGLADALVDVALIRALAATKDPKAGTVVLNFAFSEQGTAYRDECGRYLRKMSPYSIPSLIHGSQKRAKKFLSMQRYATYQLERLDRQNPHKAFASAPSEPLQINILKAFADSQYREAVFAVLEQVDHIAPRVREAARAAWMEYVDGRPPPKPPERKLELPNGKLSEEEAPLWLDHRQLADVAIRKRLTELKGTAPNRRATLVELTEELFAFYDDRRKAALLRDFEGASALVADGKVEEATVIFDRILAQQPQFDKAPEMAEVYLTHAKQLEKDKKWREAAIAFGKANAVAPNGPSAKEALKHHHLARAKLTKERGKDPTVELTIANEVDTTPTSKVGNKMLLFSGVIALVGALILFALALTLRRRSSAR